MGKGLAESFLFCRVWFEETMLSQESSNNLISIFFKQQLLIRVVSCCQRQNPSFSALLEMWRGGGGGGGGGQGKHVMLPPADWYASPQYLLCSGAYQVGLEEAQVSQETEILLQPQQEIMREQAHRCCVVRASLHLWRAALPWWYGYNGRGTSPSG